MSARLRASINVEGLLDYDWRLALGEVEITARELAGLVAQKSALVRHRGTWLRIDPTELETAAQAVSSQSPAEMLGRGLAGGPLQLMSEDEIRSLFFGDRPEPAQPSARFQGTLRPYQGRGLGWMSRLARVRLGACLADDMGLGKTVQVLAHLCDAPPPTLLICPLSVLVNWQREAARFTPHLRVRLHHGPRRESGRLAQDFDVLVTTYAVARGDEALLSMVEWRRIILDEAQHIKNPETATSRAIRRLPARHRIAMTGTPVENRLDELWSIFDFLNPGLLLSRRAFQSKYADPIEKHSDPEAAERLRRITYPFLLRRRKTDPNILADLPPKIEIKEPCRLTVEQAALYAGLLEDMKRRLSQMDDLDREARRGVLLSTLTRLKQVCNHPAQLLKESGPLAGRSGKLERLEALVAEILDLGEQALIFTQYTGAARLLLRHLTARFQTGVLYLHGGLARPQRQALIDRFQSGQAPLFLLSLKAAGTGLNLTAASHVIHYDRWWNPAVEDQATDRAWRFGQRRRVQVRKLVCVGTVEERIDALIESKRALAAEVIGAHGPSGLTEAELMRLLAP
ncbi:MAG: SNF2-related protein [Myxococcota bacterium]